MMIDVRIVGKRRDHKRNPAQQIPGDPKARPTLAWQVHQFVREHRTAKEQQDRCRVEKTFDQPPKCRRL